MGAVSDHTGGKKAYIAVFAGIGIVGTALFAFLGSDTYALGSVLFLLGGGLLLVINVLWYMKPSWFFMPSTGFAPRASFFSVAVWWAVFSIPLFRNVPEPPVVRLKRERGTAVGAAFVRLGHTFHQLLRYKQLLLFLAAFWIYDDGIGTIIKMATAYGDEIGIRLTDMTIALIITQFVGMPCSFGFG